MKNRNPKHIGFILDGNRRFARKLRLPIYKGHEFGAKKLEKLFEWLKEFNVKEATLYCLSIQNLQRKEEEVSYLFKIFKRYLKKLGNNQRIHKEKIKINFIGRLELLPKDIQELMNKLIYKTMSYSKYTVNFCVAYGGREEILDAINRLRKDYNDDKYEITEKEFEDYLYIKSQPDLIIRTGDVIRTSNFLIWQSYYSEWVFLKKMLPEITKQDIKKCIEEYKNRNRRFGR